MTAMGVGGFSPVSASPPAAVVALVGAPSHTATSADAGRVASLLFEMTPPLTTTGLHSCLSPH